MHIILAFLTSFGFVLFMLYRLGVDIRSLNPYFWFRRHQWEKKFGTKAMHQLTKPMECAAFLVVAVASLEADVTRELKQEIINLFAEEFGISNENALEFYSASSFFLKDAVGMVAEVPQVLALSKSDFQASHKASLFSMLDSIASAEGGKSANQLEFIAAIRAEFERGNIESTKW